MPNFDKDTKKVKYSKNDNRFYTDYDMSEVKRDTAIRNSKIKRGEIVPKGNNNYISVCTCGAPGCFAQGDWETVTQEAIAMWKRTHHANTSEKVDEVNCRLYKRDWYVGAKQLEDGLWHAVIGRQTYNDRGVVKTEQIPVTPMEKKLDVIAQAQKSIDDTVRHWGFIRSQVNKTV